MESFLKKDFIDKNGILSFEIKDEKTKQVTEFYDEKPFPNYKDNDNKQSILEKGNKNLLAQQFKKFIGFKKIVEMLKWSAPIFLYLFLISQL